MALPCETCPNPEEVRIACAYAAFASNVAVETAVTLEARAEQLRVAQRTESGFDLRLESLVLGLHQIDDQLEQLQVDIDKIEQMPSCGKVITYLKPMLIMQAAQLALFNLDRISFDEAGG